VPATLDIREVPTGLILRVTESRNIAKALIGPVLSGLVCGLLIYYTEISTRTLILVLLILSFSIAKEAIDILRGTNVTLEVTNLNLISRGHAPDGYDSSLIPRDTIFGLKFQTALNGDIVRPTGLYVEHHGDHNQPETCVLPHIDKTQTKQAIDAIMRRFPDTCTLPPTGVFETYLTSLHLNK
jgi:hypothetical protein